jgi:hypothetical protein
MNARRIFSDSVILVALSTAVGYLSAAAYQYYYLSYFGVPMMLMEVSFSQTLFITLITSSWLASFVVSMIYLAIRKPKTAVSKTVRWILIFLALAVWAGIPLLLVLYRPDHPWVTLVSVFATIIVVIFWIVQLWKESKDHSEKPKNFFDKIDSMYGEWPVFVVIFTFFFIGCGAAAGSVVAKSKHVFMVSDTNPNLVVVSAYSGGFIGLTFSTTTTDSYVLGNDIVLIGQDQISRDGVSFSVRDLGSLSPTVK